MCGVAPGERTSIALSLAQSVISLSTKKLAWIQIRKQDIASAMGIMRRARDVDQYPQAQPDGNRGREAENTNQETETEKERRKTRSGRGGQRRKIRKADRLYKGYIRICSWNCASANRRKMDYDLVCLQETRTCPNRPLVLQGFTVILRHQGAWYGNSSSERPQQDGILT